MIPVRGVGSWFRLEQLMLFFAPRELDGRVHLRLSQGTPLSPFSKDWLQTGDGHYSKEIPLTMSRPNELEFTQRTLKIVHRQISVVCLF